MEASAAGSLRAGQARITRSLPRATAHTISTWAVAPDFCRGGLLLAMSDPTHSDSNPALTCRPEDIRYNSASRRMAFHLLRSGELGQRAPTAQCGRPPSCAGPWAWQ